MKAGDLVRWNYFGQSATTDEEKMVGIILSDYHDKSGHDQVYKNVFWMKHQWVRPINPIHLEVISESR